ncbi:MAG: 3-demethylubiquinone-9 3-methyltransferase [Nocardioidaceae bacterium]|nr:3-demethylubiquinone-9 3-methyltransferase [Nocardioidaceae bacterium]
MSVTLNPYLNFRAQAKDAMEFYQSVFGGELTSMTFADAGGMGVPEEEQGQIMHAQIDVPGVLTLMGADTPSHMELAPVGGMSVSLSGDDEATLRGYWDGLSAGGQVQVPLEKAPWGDTFGMFVDKFGVPWLVNIAGEQAG